MKKTTLSLAISLSLAAGSVYAGGAGKLTSLKVPTSRLIIQTEQTIAAPNLMVFTKELSTQADTTMSYVRSMAIDNSYVYRIPKFKKGVELKLLITKLKSVPGVVSVEEDIMLQPMAIDDPYYDDQWDYFESTGGINVPAAWEQSTGEGTVVAVLDSGITNHDDLNANILSGYDFISDAAIANDGNRRDSDPSDTGDWVSENECGYEHPEADSSWHGTHVAGTIAAVTNNNLGIAGVAYDAKILPVRVLGKCGGRTSDIIDAIVWSSGGSVAGVPDNLYPADVINMSLGAADECFSAFQKAIDTAVENGTTVVVAAGNENANASSESPANCNNVVTVAASNRQGDRSFYSNYGAMVDITAPGGETESLEEDGILSTLNNGSSDLEFASYEYYQGTSMAAPHVAGVVALMKSVAPSATPEEIEAVLKATARPMPGSCSGGCGTGIVDASAAVSAIAGDLPIVPGTDPMTNAGTLNETALNASRSSWQNFVVNIPLNIETFTVEISGGSGDADLYVREGSEPTTSTYNCRPYQDGNNESCTFNNPGAGEWNIGIHAYSAYSGVNLLATWE